VPAYRSKVNHDEGLILLVYEIVKVLQTHCWWLKLLLALLNLFVLLVSLFYDRELCYGVNPKFVKVGSEDFLKLLDAGEIVLKRLGCEDSLLLFSGSDAACGIFILIHKTD